MSEVFLCKTGALSVRAKRDLRRAGIVVVEAENPTDCQFIRSTEVVSGSAMLVAALSALTEDDTYGAKVHRTFVRELFKAAAEAGKVGN